MKNLLRIADLEFQVHSALIDAVVAPPSAAIESEASRVLVWGLEILASTKRREYASWNPRLTAERLFATGAGKLDAWTDIAPRRIAWAEPINADDEPYAALYVFEYEVISDGEVELSRRGDGLHLHLRGTCDVRWSRRYDTNLALEIDAAMAFRGVLCGRSDEAAARAELSPFLDDERLVFERDEFGATELRPQ